ncbi:MAG: hypothetical protein ACLRFE_00030 [Clostridia bacterium]
MRLFDKLLKRNRQEQEQPQKQERSANEQERASTNATRGEVKVPYPIPLNIKRVPFKERYPDGLPLNMLKHLDYSKYGAILKQRQLLPPSYDRKPVSVEIRPSEHGDHNIGLIFKSNTSASYRIISIRQYNVTMAINDSFLYGYMPIMSREWENFCERVVYCADRGISYSRVNDFAL